MAYDPSFSLRRRGLLAGGAGIAALAAMPLRAPASQRFDPEGKFIKHWLPELKGLNKKQVHNPASLGGLFGVANYPAPIVNLSQSRDRALSAFKNLPSRQMLEASHG